MNVKKHWHKLSRWATAGALSLTMVAGSVLPAHAASPAPEAPVPTLSPWSVKTLHEGEKYGIYPLNWYYGGSFQKQITAGNFKSLMNATAKKLDQLGFKKKEASLSFPVGQTITRETVITSLHKLLSNYELPETAGLASEAPVDFMKENGIVQGTKAGLQLDQPCTAEQAAVMASRLVEFAYDTAGKGAEGLMWKVTNGNNTLYLLGSIHLGNTDMYPMHKSIREAFEASDDLWVEVDIVNGDMSYFTEKMVYSDGTKVKDHVSADTYEKLQKVLKKLQLPAETFDGYKPFAISSTLSTFSVLDNPAETELASVTGVDRYFLGKALLSGKPIHELEGIKLQADLFANVPAEEQEKELNMMLDGLLSDQGQGDAAEQLKEMQQAWIRGDAEGLTKNLSDSDLTQSEGNRRLFGERDKNMAKKLVELLEQKGEHTSFVVVGAGHYVIKGMVVDLLKEKGYNVEFMQ